MFSINLKKGQKQREHTTKGNGDLSEEFIKNRDGNKEECRMTIPWQFVKPMEFPQFMG